MSWSAELRKSRRRGIQTVDWHGPGGDLLRFGFRVPEDLAAAEWGGTVKLRPEIAGAGLATFTVDTLAEPVDGQVRLVVSLLTAWMDVDAEYFYDLWYLAAGDDEPRTVLEGHMHPYQRVSPPPGS